MTPALIWYAVSAGINFVRGLSVRELIRANDAVLVSAVGALLDGAGIHLVFKPRAEALRAGAGSKPSK